MTKRRGFTPDFKAKVALETLRGDQTVQSIASKYKVHPTQVGSWKRQAMDGLASLFDNGDQASKAASEAEIKKLHAKIGQLLVERDFLAKASGR